MASRWRRIQRFDADDDNAAMMIGVRTPTARLHDGGGNHHHRPIAPHHIAPHPPRPKNACRCLVAAASPRGATGNRVLAAAACLQTATGGRGMAWAAAAVLWAATGAATVRRRHCWP